MEIKTIEGAEITPIWNRMTCLFYECCAKKEEREKSLLLKKCMYNPSIFRCEEFKKRIEGATYELDYL